MTSSSNKPNSCSSVMDVIAVRLLVEACVAWSVFFLHWSKIMCKGIFSSAPYVAWLSALVFCICSNWSEALTFNDILARYSGVNYYVKLLIWLSLVARFVSNSIKDKLRENSSFCVKNKNKKKTYRFQNPSLWETSGLFLCRQRQESACCVEKPGSCKHFSLFAAPPFSMKSQVK